MTKSKTTVIRQELETDMDRDPNVQNYRLGQLEKTVADGFVKIDKKMDDFIASFVTKEDMKISQEATEKEHGYLWARIKALENNNTWLLRTFIASVIGGIVSIAFLAIQTGVVK